MAREQIEHRLGRSVVGQRLLSYPHFIDTIHGFVNRFLALPWLYSNGYPSPTIDDDVTTSYRRSVLGKDYFGVEAFLSKKRSGFDRLRLSDRHMTFDLGGRPFPAGPSAKSHQHAKRAIEAAATAGYFCYDEMFVWADALLEDYPAVPDWLAHRFPLVILDEMQDTYERQASFLSAVFPRTSDKIVVQRVGRSQPADIRSTGLGLRHGGTLSRHRFRPLSRDPEQLPVRIADRSVRIAARRAAGRFIRTLRDRAEIEGRTRAAVQACNFRVSR